MLPEKRRKEVTMAHLIKLVMDWSIITLLSSLATARIAGGIICTTSVQSARDKKASLKIT